MATTEHVAADERHDAVVALANELGWRLLSHRVIAHEAREHGFVTGHELEVDSAGGIEKHTVYLDGDSAGRPGTVSLVDDSGRALSAWLYPSDPDLPALAALVYPSAAAVVLERLGFDPSGLALSIPSYRPGKRAVVRMTTNHATYFAKVVKPELVDPLRARHESWRTAGIPVPRVLAWASEGLLILESLGGVELSTVLATTPPTVVAVAMNELETRIHAVHSTTTARRSLARRVAWYTARLQVLCGDSADRIETLERRVTGALKSAAPNPLPVTIHGDLHLGQVFVDPANPKHPTGVLDIDTAGLGDPADDTAALWAHLIATAELRVGSDDSAAGIHRALAVELRDKWERDGDPGFASRVSAIAATHLIGHALSGSLTPQRALDLADETLLTFGS